MSAANINSAPLVSTATTSIQSSQKLNESELKAAKLYEEAITELKILDETKGKEEDAIKILKKFVSILDTNKRHAGAQYSIGYMLEFYTEKEALPDTIQWYTAAHTNGHSQADAAVKRVMQKIISQSKDRLDDSKKYILLSVNHI